MSFGSKLKATRVAQGLTQKDLSDLSGVDPRMLKLYEEDQMQPKLLTAIDLADSLNVSMDYLCERGHRIEVWCY